MNDGQVKPPQNGFASDEKRNECQFSRTLGQEGKNTGLLDDTRVGSDLI
jgi:hypothetical protein